MLLETNNFDVAKLELAHTMFGNIAINKFQQVGKEWDTETEEYAHHKAKVIASIFNDLPTGSSK